MAKFEIILVLLCVAGALQILARRWHIPHPALLVIGGAILATIPGLPRIETNPDLLFIIFIPPLLYWTAVTSSFREFSAEFWPIVRLGIFLVVTTIVAVAVTAHVLTPAFTWAAAFALAAIIAPPDPIAASAVMRPLDAPPRLVSILEGEGLLNDATALVAYRMAIAAQITGTFSLPKAIGGIVITGTAGIIIGLIVGWAIVRIRDSIRDYPVVGNALSLLTPFAAYLPADKLGASGVLSVVAAGLYIGRKWPRMGSAAMRVQAEAIWSMTVFLLESLIFILVGLDLPYAARALSSFSFRQLLAYAGIISAVVILVRLIWVWPSAYLPRLASRGRLPPWRWVLFVGWAGMRGGDSLVLALALPLATRSGAPFPARDLIIFLTFSVIFATLVLQAVTLTPLLRLLGLAGSEDDDKEEAHARRVVAEVALQRLETARSSDDVPPELLRSLRKQLEKKAVRWSTRDVDGHGRKDAEHRAVKRVGGPEEERESRAYRKLHGEILDAEREAVVKLRDQNVISDQVMHRVLRDIDLETMVVEATEDDAPSSPYGLE